MTRRSTPGYSLASLQLARGAIAQVDLQAWKIAYRIDKAARVIYVVRVWHAARNEIEIE